MKSLTKFQIQNKFIIILIFIINVTLCSCSSTTIENISNKKSTKKSIISSNKNSQNASNKTDASKNNSNSLSNKTSTPEIVVYICGAVNSPGVYSLKEGSRLVDAIKASGGFTSEADSTYNNQACKLSDGEQIYIPTTTETNASTNRTIQNNSGEILFPNNSNSSNSISNNDGSAKVNINSATKNELMTLTGIGENKAESIIKYRETNGAFASIEDLKNIQGIKEGVFSKIKNDITV